MQHRLIACLGPEFSARNPALNTYAGNDWLRIAARIADKSFRICKLGRRSNFAMKSYG